MTCRCRLVCKTNNKENARLLCSLMMNTACVSVFLFSPFPFNISFSRLFFLPYLLKEHAVTRHIGTVLADPQVWQWVSGGVLDRARQPRDEAVLDVWHHHQPPHHRHELLVWIVALRRWTIFLGYRVRLGRLSEHGERKYKNSTSTPHKCLHTHQMRTSTPPPSTTPCQPQQGATNWHGPRHHISQRLNVQCR